MSFSIRRAEYSDCNDLTGVAHAAKRHWNYPEASIRLWADDLTVTAELVRDHAVYVAEDADGIAGFYALTAMPPTLDLEHFWVRPGRMRQRVGTTLFAHALQTARALGATAITIASDPNAVGFYEKMGARRIGDVPSAPEGRTLPLLRIDVG
jgi:GNAT superfamily N-acetyltransferase